MLMFTKISLSLPEKKSTYAIFTFCSTYIELPIAHKNMAEYELIKSYITVPSYPKPNNQLNGLLKEIITFSNIQAKLEITCLWFPLPAK